jgi:hypothetical protein
MDVGADVLICFMNLFAHSTCDEVEGNHFYVIPNFSFIEIVSFRCYSDKCYLCPLSLPPSLSMERTAHLDFSIAIGEALI